MRLVGWNDIPLNHGATFEGVPLWLRAWFHTPFADRFAYPFAVRHGHGWLTPNRGAEPAEAEIAQALADGWRFVPSDSAEPGLPLSR